MEKLNLAVMKETTTGEEHVDTDSQVFRENISSSQTVLRRSKTYDQYNVFLQILFLPFKLSWQITVLISVLCNYFTTTYNFSFLTNNSITLYLYSYVFDIIYLADFVLNISYKCCRYRKHRIYKQQRSSISLIVDGLSVTHPDIIYILSFKQRENWILFLLRSLTFIQLYRVQYFFNIWGNTAANIQWILFIIKYILYFCVLQHTVACLWYTVSDKKQSVWKQFTTTDTPSMAYFISCYYSLVTTANSGISTMSVSTYSDTFICIASMMIGFILTNGIYVGSLTSHIANKERRNSTFIYKLKAIKNRVENIKMASQWDSISKYYEDFWKRRKGVKKSDYFETIPLPLKKEICFDIYFNFFHTSLLFCNMNENFLRNISLRMSCVFCLPGEHIHHENVVKSFMAFVQSGSIEVLSDEDDESPLVTLAAGSFIGAASLALAVPSRSTVQAATNVELRLLNTADFYKEAINFPEIRKYIHDSIKMRVNEAYEKISEKKMTETLFDIAVPQIKVKKPIQLIKEKIHAKQNSFNCSSSSSSSNAHENKFVTNDIFLQLYNITDNIPQVSRDIMCLISSFPWIILPNSNMNMLRVYFIFVVVVGISFIYPYFIAFEREFTPFLILINDSVNIIFFADIFIQCITAIEIENNIVSDFKYILSYRISSFSFYLDLFSTIPIETTAQLISNDTERERIKCLLLINRLFRVWMIPAFFSRLESDLWKNVILVRTAKFILYFLLFSHWTGVILYMAACFYPVCNDKSWYFTAMLSQIAHHDTKPGYETPSILSAYFALNLLSGVGYGDLTPQNPTEIGIICVFVLLGVFFVGNCLAQLSATFILLDKPKVSYQETVFAAMNFMQNNNMDKEIINRVSNYFRLQWSYDEGFTIMNNSPLLEEATFHIQQQVLVKERMHTLCEIPLFQEINIEFLRMIAAHSRMVILPPGELVVYAGGCSREIYVIQEGYCHIISNEFQRIRLLCPNSHFGELELIFGISSQCSVQTITHCKLINISHAVYLKALSLFPEIQQDILTIIKESDIQNKIKPVERYNPISVSRRKKSSYNKLTWSERVMNEFISSFINVRKLCKETRESYNAPFRKLGKLRIIQFTLIPITIVPYGCFLKIWYFIRLILAIIIGFMWPIEQCLYPYVIFPSFVTKTINVFSIIDLFIMLHVCYFNDKGILVKHPLFTAINYLKHSFILDLFACFPFEMLNALIFPTSQHFRRVSSLNKVFQMYRLIITFKYLESDIMKKTDILRTLKFIPFIIVLINMLSSLLVALTCHHKMPVQIINDSNLPPEKGETESDIMKCSEWLTRSQFGNITHPAEIYLIGYYWITTTLVGIGLGDITAHNKEEIIFAIAIIIMGVLLFGCLLSSIASSKADLNSSVVWYYEMVNDAVEFLKREGVNQELQHRLITYFELQWKRTSGVQQQEVFKGLHTVLAEDAVLAMYESTFHKVPLFKHVPLQFLRVIGKHMQEVYFLKGTSVIRSYDIQAEIYIIFRGNVEVSHNGNVVTSMGPGGIFGNLGNTPVTCCHVNIVATKNIDCLKIPSTTFNQVLKEYPDVNRHLEPVFKQATDYMIPTYKVEDLSIQSGSQTISEESYSSIKSKEIEDQGKESSVVYQAKGTTKFLLQPYKWFKFSIRPDSPIYIVMAYVITIISYIHMMTVSYNFFFQDLRHEVYVMFDLPVELLFYINMFLKLHKQYCNHYGEYITDPKKIREKFTADKIKLLLEIIPNIPVDIIALIYLPGERKLILSAVRLIHLGRFKYLIEFYNEKSNLLMTNKKVLSIATTFIWVTLQAHFFACIWYFTACPLGNCTVGSWIEFTPFKMVLPVEQYVLSLYYIMSLFTTTGYGDIIPYNNAEIVISVAMMLISKFSIALFIGDMISILDSYALSLVNFRYGLMELKDFLKNQSLNQYMLIKVSDYMKQLWKEGRGKQMPPFILEAPFCLKSELMSEMFGSHITNSFIFEGINPDFSRIITSRLKHLIFFKGNYIVQQGDIDQHMYFIHRGEISVLTVHSNLTETVHCVLKTNEMFGAAQGLYKGLPHHFAFRARNTVDILALDLNDWYSILQYFPTVKETLHFRVNNMYINI